MNQKIKGKRRNSKEFVASTKAKIDEINRFLGNVLSDM